MDWKTLIGFTILFHVVVYIWRKSWILRFDTKKLNKIINGISTKRIRKYFRVWFRIGTYITLLIGFPFTLWLFLRSIFHHLIPFLISWFYVSDAGTIISSTEISMLNPHAAGRGALELHSEGLNPFPDAELTSFSQSTVVDDTIVPGNDSPNTGISSSGYLAIQPILPGWNFPLSKLPLYLFAILVSVFVHEMGHAISSASHSIPIVSIGISLFGPLIPAAHVELNSIQLAETPLKKQLDILSAGVWMNMYLSFITYFLLPSFLPWIIWPTHQLGVGAAVTGVLPGSGAGGPGGLEIGDVIVGVDYCQVNDVDSWLTCLERIWETDPLGFCLDDGTIQNFINTSSDPGCCKPNEDTSATHLCFLQFLQQIQSDQIKSNRNLKVKKSVVEDEQDPHSVVSNHDEVQVPIGNPIGSSLNLPQSSKKNESDIEINAEDKDETASSKDSKSFCLPAKPIVTMKKNLTTNNYIHYCSSPSYSCSSPQLRSLTVDREDSDSLTKQCYMPRLVLEYHDFRMIQIHRKTKDDKESVLFVGDVWDLKDGLRLSNYSPKSSSFLESIFGNVFVTMIPVHLETCLLLIAGLSAGLAVVNTLPIFGLDGYHIAQVLMLHFLSKNFETKKILKILNVISWGALLIALLSLFSSIVLL